MALEIHFKTHLMCAYYAVMKVFIFFTVCAMSVIRKLIRSSFPRLEYTQVYYVSSSEGYSSVFPIVVFCLSSVYLSNHIRFITLKCFEVFSQNLVQE